MMQYDNDVDLRLDSHIPWPYFIVRDQSGVIVAPSLDVVWDNSYQYITSPIQSALKSVLSKKTKAAIWIVSHCPTNSVREDYLHILQEILLFLPPGSYIDANKLNQYNLAVIILQAVVNQTNYEQYFKWRNHYTISSPTNDCHPLCHLCAALQTNYGKNAPVIKKFRKWWMGNDGMKWCLSDAYWKETSKVNIDAKHLYRLMYQRERPSTNNSTLANTKTGP
ncbi:alpha-(1,3)-fucosyltransferase C-like [Hyposmocoma kahamanoa]|uniref:alpha-(1,3)-fucosyltransferase C-like n=1 Tax=Hyposmocoma kahamanoa TaxID=1477025 RepID=UPI000E6D6963|nr:alpha-(1,3)-fucosyltransferase C-like [Hyposmocoma kahamanoa]